MILGGNYVFPRPVIDLPTSSGNIKSVPSDSWYTDFDNDHLVDGNISISRIASRLTDPDIIIQGLKTAVELHLWGGYSLDSKIEFSSDTTPPYGVCSSCTKKQEFFELMSKKDYIFFWGHGSETEFKTYSYENIFDITYIDSVNFHVKHPVIIAFNPCYAGHFYYEFPSLSNELIGAGAAAYMANTASWGYYPIFKDNFMQNIENGIRIGDALINSIRHTILTYPSSSDVYISTHQFNLYGDPTLKRRVVGDLNKDGQLTLSDAIMILKLLTKSTSHQAMYKSIDINYDGKVSIEEVIFIFQKISSLR